MTACVLFLGYVISKYGISMDDSKLEAIKQWPRPYFYHRFISHFNSIVSLITDCMKAEKFSWSEDHRPKTQDRDRDRTLSILIRSTYGSDNPLRIAQSRIRWVGSADPCNPCKDWAILSRIERSFQESDDPSKGSDNPLLNPILG